MILGIKELPRLIKEKKLIEGLSERELENPEGSGFDLRMGEVYELEGYGYLGLEERETPKSSLVAKYDSKKVASYIFEPGKYYLIKTVEKVNLPIDIAGIIFPRTTLSGQDSRFLMES